MKFEKYQHVERLGTVAVEGILDKPCYVFPKLDGTNTSVYLNDRGEVEVASRNRVLSVHNDNQGVCNYVLSQPKFKAYLEKFPNHRLFGEWLIPNNIRDYRGDVWRKLYIFDVMQDGKYIPYLDYFDDLWEFGIDCIHPIAPQHKYDAADIMKVAAENDWLMQDGKIGEGVVVKRYDFVNQFGNTVWAKYVLPRSQPQKKSSATTAPVDAVEFKIVEQFLTAELIDKEFAKISADGWQSKFIGNFFKTVWHVFITEETANFLQKFHNPKIDFKTLNHCVIDKIKASKPELF